MRGHTCVLAWGPRAVQHERELVDRQERKIDRLIKSAGFKYQPEISSIAYNADRDLSKEAVLNLASGGYILN